jgi:small-conductance mechanosensitive channel
MKQIIQYLILIILVIGSSLMVVHYIAPMIASVVFCISLATLLIKIVNKIINSKNIKND